MNVSIQNFTQLNDYLEKAAGKLRMKPEKEAATRKKIRQVVMENFRVVNGLDFNEVGRLLHSVKQIAASGEDKGIVTWAIRSVAAVSGSLNLDAIGKFKELDEMLYYESLAKHISSKELPIKILGLSEEEMIKIMPWVTYLDLTDSARVDLPFINISEFVDYTITDQFVEKLLENALSLESLKVGNSNISGSAFSNKNLIGLSNLKRLYISHCHALKQIPSGLQNLSELRMTDCELFNQSIIGFPSLKSLSIIGCPSFNASINGLPSLEHLSVFQCDVFNQNLDGLPNLKSLYIKFCRAFTESLNGLSELESLDINHCNAFNQSLNGLQKLMELEISNCNAFNQSLNGLQKLMELEISNCNAFNQSLNGLSELESLDINHCNAFNQSLNGLQKLDELKIENCDAFNQSLNGLQNLMDLDIFNCNAFNQSLNGLQNLTRLKIKDCDAFKLKDIHTACILNKLRPKMLQMLLKNKSPGDDLQLTEDLLRILEEKTKALENITPEIGDYLYFLPHLTSPENRMRELYERIPLLDSLLLLYSMNEAIKRGEELESVKAEFTALKEKANYFDFLQITIRAFPELASFLIRDLKEEIVPHLKSLCISDQLPLESRMALLPLFPAEQIWQFVSAAPQETKEKWLEREIEWEQFSGRVEGVLTDIVENNIEGADEAARDNLLGSLKELMAKIPFSTLAVLASVSPKIILPYTFAMEDAQMASVIPLLPDEALFEHLKNQPMPTHFEFLLFASIKQKEAYMADDLMKDPESLTEWNQAMAQIEELIRRFENEKTQECFQLLENAWREIVNKTNFELQVYGQVGQVLKEKLLKFSPDKEYENKVTAYFEPKMKRSAEILQNLKAAGEKIKVLEGQVVGQVEVPEEFVDSITNNLMTYPYHHPSAPQFIYDFSTWQRTLMHPITRVPVNLEELIPDTELQEKIEAFLQEHPGAG